MSDHGIGGFPEGAGCPRCGPSIPKLVVSRIYYFLTFGMVGTFWMLLATFSRYLGLTATQAGIISGSRPLLSGVSVAVWTHIADRFQWTKKPILLMSVASHCLLSISLVFFRPQFSTTSHLNCSANSTTMAAAGAITTATPAGAITTATPLSGVVALGHFTPGPGMNVSAAACQLVNRTSALPTWVNYGSLHLSLSETFATVLTLVLVNEALGSGITSMADVATYSHLGKENYVQFGWIRVFGAAGWAVGVFSLTMAAQYFNKPSYGGSRGSHGDDNHGNALGNSKVYLSGNYSLVFSCLAVLLVFSFLTACLFQFRRHSTQVARGALRNTLRQVLRPRILLLAVVIFHSGMAIGATLSFVFWLIQDLGGRQAIMGVASLISATADVPAYLLAPLAIRRLGAERVVGLGLVCQIAFFFGITSVTAPWAVLFFQPIVGGMHGLLWAAVQAAFVPLSAAGTETLMIGLLHTLMYGFGAGAGSFAGGALVDRVGSRWMFRILAFQSVLMLLLHTLSTLYFGTARPGGRDDGFRPLGKGDDDDNGGFGSDDVVPSGEESDLTEETALTNDVKHPLETLKKSVSNTLQ